ncbi:GNAT family N-acetyltransferase [Halalkalicoccus subterraneus]|uniref:GNAT family N-acetyltransferase n=1 Tax=Halalkalicoccus subterraneus TaxID=2675002 RepID=UPI000EFADA9C|nr:GNAT family N-acetyltransferase [Halalkalicoccus subterraneus]
MEYRSYDPDTDRDGLWELKRAFETGLGTGTGDEEKRAAYEAKLTDEYRERYLDWVDRCVADDPRCLTVADDGDLGGYVFVLPERMAMIWDAAVVNELYVSPAHRGSGVADGLMESACTLAREQDLPLDRLVLDVDPENERACAFYDRCGFDPWGEMIAHEL